MNYYLVKFVISLFAKKKIWKCLFYFQIVIGLGKIIKQFCICIDSRREIIVWYLCIEQRTSQFVSFFPSFCIFFNIFFLIFFFNVFLIELLIVISLTLKRNQIRARWVMNIILLPDAIALSLNFLSLILISMFYTQF